MSRLSDFINALSEHRIKYDKICSSYFLGNNYVLSDEVYLPVDKMESRYSYNHIVPIKNQSAFSRYHYQSIKRSMDFDTARMIILYPVQYFLWPVDYIFIPEASTSAWVYYIPDTTNKMYQLLSDRLLQFGFNSSDKEGLKAECETRFKIAKKLLIAGESFFKAKQFRYGCWRADQILLKGEDDIYILFPENINTVLDDREFDKTFRDWCLQYDPYAEKYGTIGDYYSFLILLFYILVGRYPFESRDAESRSFSSDADSNYWNNAYRQDALFIFSESINDAERIGLYSHEEKFKYAWESILTAEMRDIFQGVFDKNKKIRADKAFEKLCNLILKKGGSV